MAGALGAIRDLSTTVSKFVEAASEKEERTSSAIKWERKRPTIKADDAESLMSELIALDNTYADLGYKTFKKKWTIFRPALEGKAKAKVELELEENQLSAESIAKFTEE